jgi:amino acid transporter/nucleotide-binding universal stress UspA family protein
MSTTPSPAPSAGGPPGQPGRTPTNSTSKLLRTTQVIVVGSVMFTFISYWKTAAVVLCDLASTSYYIGGIVEQAIGKAAPWFILAVMLFSYTVRSVYIESCSMFVRGGVYRVVRAAMGGFMGKLAVAALLFDYVLTGPISSVTAGQYLVSLGFEFASRVFRMSADRETFETVKSLGSMAFAMAVTVYFYRLNVMGIHESSDRAFKIMIATTVMAVLLIGCCVATLFLADRDFALPPTQVNLDVKPHMNPITGHPHDPLGFLGQWLPAGTQAWLRNQAVPWFHLAGLFGILVAFGHSILAMSGEETLAQVYREVESPKLPNFRKAAFVVFVYSLLLTSLVSFLAVVIIPDDRRLDLYADNLLGGLAMSVVGPDWWKLSLNVFVVVVGSMILSGAVNTAIIGSNGVLNRVAEDGVVPVWLQKPHPKYGTTYRILRLILVLKLVTILVSRGNVLLLGEAYAFGVVWSFVFMSVSMVILRFRRPDLPREYKVPFNLRVGGVEIPFGLIFVFVVLVSAALINLLTKEVATVAGLVFTAGFLIVFSVSERVNRGREAAAAPHAHVEQFSVQSSETVSTESLGLRRPFTKLVAIRSPHNLFMLEKALAETDPETTSVVVMTAKVLPEGDATVRTDLDPYDQELMTAVVNRAEKAGKRVKPLIVPTNNALHAVLRLADELFAQEVILGASNKYAADEQMELIALYWANLHGGEPKPLTVRLLSKDRDIYLDLHGGNRIPKVSERQARTVAELRAAGVGIDRVLMVHDGTRAGSDLFQGVLTMLDPQVALGLAHVPAPEASATLLQQDTERAQTLGRDITVHAVPPGDTGAELVELARESAYDLLILPRPAAGHGPEGRDDPLVEFVLQHASCPVMLAVPPAIPPEVAAE